MNRTRRGLLAALVVAGTLSLSGTAAHADSSTETPQPVPPTSAQQVGCTPAHYTLIANEEVLYTVNGVATAPGTYTEPLNFTGTVTVVETHDEAPHAVLGTYPLHFQAPNPACAIMSTIHASRVITCSSVTYTVRVDPAGVQVFVAAVDTPPGPPGFPPYSQLENLLVDPGHTGTVQLPILVDPARGPDTFVLELENPTTTTAGGFDLFTDQVSSAGCRKAPVHLPVTTPHRKVSPAAHAVKVAARPAPQAAAVTSGPVLASTGASTWPALMLSGALLLLGGASVAASRR